MISFILVNFNSSEHTLNCVNSIEKFLSGVERQIIVIDNGSTPSQKTILEPLKKIQGLQIIYSEKNIGFGPGNNLARPAIRGDILIFINNDTLVVDETITIGISWLYENNTAGIVGGNLLTKIHEPDISYGDLPCSIIFLFRMMINGLPFIKFRGMMSPVPASIAAPFKVGYPMGALMMIRRSDMDAINWFDEKLFLYFEEADLALRLKDTLKKDCFCHPAVRLVHLSGGSSESVDLSNRYFQSWHYLLTKHHFNHAYILIFKIVLCVLLLRNVFVQIFKCNPRRAFKNLQILQSAAIYFRPMTNPD